MRGYWDLMRLCGWAAAVFIAGWLAWSYAGWFGLAALALVGVAWGMWRGKE